MKGRAETDLFVPLPADGEQWDPHTIHTHYFGFTVPEARLGAFIYLRWMPYFPLCQGGICVYQGTNNLYPCDSAFYDYEITMPWPTINGNRFTTANGLSIAFPEPGRLAELTYESRDGRTTLDLVATAVTPLEAREHVLPSEEQHRVAESGGTEQFMHYTGTATIHGERHEVDCHFPRDRSWRQVRSESREANIHPPVSWTPIWFGDDLAFNQIGFEAQDTNPDWLDVYKIPEGAPTHHFGWVARGHAQVRDVAGVRLAVTDRHPLTFAPRGIVIETTDETGEEYRFEGKAIAMAPIMMWPNIAAFDSIFTWQDGPGRIAYGTVQSMYSEAYAHALKQTRTL